MHTETVMIYFDDLDAMGIVHNGRYVTLLERALATYWARAGWPYDPGQPRFAEVLFVVREFAITYHVPIARVGTELREACRPLLAGAEPGARAAA